MKKQSLFGMFMRRFIKTFLFTVFLFVVGFLSYKVTHFYYDITDADKKVKSDSIIKDLVSNIKVEEISKNLIYSVNSDTNKIDKMMLEIFNTKTGNLDYITIPVNTEFTISNELYQTLYRAFPEIPQIIQLTDLTEYFDNEKVGAYGILILEDLLDVRVNYYTGLNTLRYQQYFQSSHISLAEIKRQEGGTNTDTSVNANEEEGNLNLEVFSESLKNEVSAFSSKDQLEEYIKSNYKNVKSNLTVKNKLKYLDDFYNLELNNVYFYHLYGKVEEKNFIVDVTKSNALLSNLLGNGSYTTGQESNGTDGSDNASTSIGLKIKILNGSKITGLAAKYKEKLTLSGYTIVGVDNYEESILTNSKIIVREENTGLDLLEHFNEAEIEVGELQDGIDIEIILGTNDNILQ